MKQITVNFVISVDEGTQKFLGSFVDGLFRPSWASASAPAPAADQAEEPAPAPAAEEPKKPAKKPAPKKKAAAPSDARAAAAANLAAIDAVSEKPAESPEAPKEAPAPVEHDKGTPEYNELLQKVGKLGARLQSKGKDAQKAMKAAGVSRLDTCTFEQLSGLLEAFEAMEREVA